jgi:hypothetical protein
MTETGAEVTGRHDAAAATLMRAVLCMLVLGALCWLVYHQPQRAWTPPAQLELQVGSAHYRVEPSRLEWIEAFTRLHFSTGHMDGRALLAKELDAGLSRVFEEVHGRLPDFADWYYSLGGEYTRLTMTVLARLGRAEEGFVAARTEQLLFPAEPWAAALGSLEAEVVARFQLHQQDVREGWLAELARRLEPYRVPAPIAGAGRPVADLRLDGLNTHWLEREREALENRAALSSLAAGSVAAGIALRGAAASGRAVAVRGIGRGASRAAPAAGSAMTACSVAGPYAIGCAVLAGAAAWIATDWVLLRVDEAVNREALLAAMANGLVEVRSDMLAGMLEAYDAVTAAYLEGVEADISSTFRPAGTAARAR